MDLTRTALIVAIDASMLDSADAFGEPESDTRSAEFGRCLDAAVSDFNRVQPLEAAGSLELIAGTADYAAPADALEFIDSEWTATNAGRDPWDCRYQGSLPRPRLVRVANIKTWRFAPAPGCAVLAALGSSYAYTYKAAHSLSENASEATIDSAQAPLLILRAQAEAAKDLALRNITKPIQMRDGLYSSMTRNGTPAAIADQLMRLFEQQARHAAPLYGNLQGVSA